METKPMLGIEKTMPLRSVPHALLCSFPPRCLFRPPLHDSRSRPQYVQIRFQPRMLSSQDGTRIGEPLTCPFHETRPSVRNLSPRAPHWSRIWKGAGEGGG